MTKVRERSIAHSSVEKEGAVRDCLLVNASHLVLKSRAKRGITTSFAICHG
jgi:hypothetical protein